MVNINIEQKEIDALDVVLKKTKVPIVIGYILGSLRAKIQQSLARERELQLREKYGKTEKSKNKNTGA